jgi:hypothetical protein
MIRKVIAAIVYIAMQNAVQYIINLAELYGATVYEKTEFAPGKVLLKSAPFRNCQPVNTDYVARLVAVTPTGPDCDCIDFEYFYDIVKLHECHLPLPSAHTR